ncbi:MAG: WD40 repeat domain-containing protein [Isosphaeraceae bacterium]
MPIVSRWNRRRGLEALATLTSLAVAGLYLLPGGENPPELPRKRVLAGTASGYVSGLAFSRDGRYLASGGEHLFLHDLKAGSSRRLRLPRPPVPHRDEARANGFDEDGLLTLALDFSPLGDLLATGDHGGQVRLWDVRTGDLVAELEGHSDRRVLSLDFTPDGQTLASAGDDWVVRLWDVRTLAMRSTLTRAEPQEPFYQVNPRPTGHAIGFTPNGDRLRSVDGRIDPRFLTWDLSTLASAEGSEESPPLWPYRVSPDAESVLAGDATSVSLWKIGEGAKTLELRQPLPDAWAGSGVSFRPDGRVVAIPWNARSHSWIDRRPKMDQAILSAVGVRPGTSLVVALHDTKTGEPLFAMEGETTAAFSADGRMLATADLRGRLTLWDASPLPDAPPR